MKIFGIGRNYAAHAKELKNKTPSEPVVFTKPDTCLLKDNKPFYYPSFSNNIHHEIELVIRINRNGKNIEERFAHKYYNEIGLGIDFTARDLQDHAKKNGLPWTIAKGFDQSGVISEFINKKEINDLNQLNFKLEIDGLIKQTGNTALMLFSIDQLIAYISRFFTLKIGDLIFTGTPEGVGPVSVGQHLIGYLGDRKMLDFEIR